MTQELEQQIERELNELGRTEGPFAFSRLYGRYSQEGNLEAQEIFRRKILTYDPLAEPSVFRHARHTGKFIESTFMTVLRNDRPAMEMILERSVLETTRTTEVNLADIYQWCHNYGYQEGNRKIGPKILQEAIDKNSMVENNRWIGIKPDEKKAPEMFHTHLKSIYQFFKNYNDGDMLAQTREELAKNVLRSGNVLPKKGWISGEVGDRQDAFDIFTFFERERDDEGLKLVVHYCGIKAAEVKGKEEHRHNTIFSTLYYIGQRFNNEELLQLGREGHAKTDPSWAFLGARPSCPDKDSELMRLSMLEWVKNDPINAYGASRTVNYAFGMETARAALLERIKVNAYTGGTVLSILEDFRRANDPEGISQLMETEQYQRIKK